LGLSQFHVRQTVLPQALHQDIGKRREPQAQLITLKLVGGGAVTEQVELIVPRCQIGKPLRYTLYSSGFFLETAGSFVVIHFRSF
jgi:hypothetical protein